MTTRDELARSWASDRGLAPTPGVLGMARRRIRAWGPLAQTPLVHLPVVRVRVLQHGSDLVAPGCVLAEIWVSARDDEQTQRLASEIHRVIEQKVWPGGQLVVAAVHRARAWDRWRAWWEWRRTR